MYMYIYIYIYRERERERERVLEYTPSLGQEHDPQAPGDVPENPLDNSSKNPPGK